MKTKKITKLEAILIDREMTQRDLQRLIYDTQDVFLGDDRISKMVNGKLTNIQLRTAKVIADALGVTIDDICEC